MQLPESDTLGKALKAIRRDSLKMTSTDFARENDWSRGTVNNYETGKIPSYDVLRGKILPAYGVEDFDLLMDFCSFLEGRSKGFSIFRHDTSSEYASKDVGTHHYRYARAAKKRGARMRMDWLEIRENENLVLRAHDGCEAVMVIEGNAIFSIEGSDGLQEEELGLFDSVSFNSMMPHCFRAVGGLPVRLVVARPAGASLHGYPIG